MSKDILFLFALRRGVSGAVARAKIRSEYIFALDFFGSFFVKKKGTNKINKKFCFY